MTRMKICILGAGAIGGLIAARLATADAEVSVIARGAHLQAMQQKGLTLLSEGQACTHHLRATSDATELGVQDYVIVAVKSGGLAAALPAILPLLGPTTTLVPAMNGVPWWFFSGFGGDLDGVRLEGVDPGGVVASAISPERIMGCVVYPSAYVAMPGVVQHTGRWELYLGEPDGSVSQRARVLSGLLSQAGFDCKLTTNIRREIWTKLIGNASFNPVSALTGATLDYMLAEPAIYTLLEALMNEVIGVGRTLGLHLDETALARLERGRPLGAIKFSMLQDLEQGRPLEFEALTGAVLDIAERLAVKTPALRTIHSLIQLRSESLIRVRQGA